jgi:hypothetical protein
VFQILRSRSVTDDTLLTSFGWKLSGAIYICWPRFVNLPFGLYWNCRKEKGRNFNFAFLFYCKEILGTELNITNKTVVFNYVPYIRVLRIMKKFRMCKMN